MKFNESKIKGLYVVELQPLIDERGFFVRSYCDKALRRAGITKSIKQINHSFTSKVGTIRGMHYQHLPHAEIKMVRCIAGEIFDVAIDLRKGSDTFLQWHGEYLSAGDFKMMVIPEGFAHGFQAIKENTEIFYPSTASYSPRVESGVLFNDKSIGIEWPLQVADVSDKDLKHGVITKEFKGIII